MTDYDSTAWRAFVDGTGAGLSARIDQAQRESVINRLAASASGDTESALVFSNRLVKITEARARWVGEGDAADISDLAADIAAHSNLYDTARTITTLFTSAAVFIVVAILAVVLLRWWVSRK